MAGINGISGGIVIQAANGPQPGAATRANAPAPSVGNAGPVAKPSVADKPVGAQEMQQSADKVQQMLAKAAPNLTFSVDRDSGRTVIKIVDPATHEVLRQIPAEEILRMDKNLDQMIARLKGLLIDRQG